MTLRQLFYRLVSRLELENSRGDYQRLSRVMTTAREADEIPFDFIVDRSRPTYDPTVFDDLPGGLEALRRCYRRDRWPAFGGLPSNCWRFAATTDPRSAP